MKQINVPAIYADALRQPHLLIAGATGSGKSTAVRGLIYTATALNAGLILIDPKRVELREWRNLPQVLHASDPDSIARAIWSAERLLERRLTECERRELKTYPGQDVYVIIDEFADLMTTDRDRTEKPLLRLAQLGRAAKIHLILATQRPTRDIITGQIKVNIDARLALRCPTRQDSRNILDCAGAEMLPRFGFGYYRTPDTVTPRLVRIDPIPDDIIRDRIANLTKTK